ncbi:hypothetical protein FNF29_00561 [Cafeteria roenbergensis]|nr:hypothetical protein FNF29_00561 [Cafeteria roenbergensis]KAA0167909.1 hypothetical protein FNF28_02655 [Cafeteria roenbergensis]KAA0169052.1 hypothetical protein FNF31_00212 [Cafeteria roenbergensis]|eukprot:KAA0157209.1 hypothetical protein FNF29_00561 [Cafeteria roenbergensis]
MVGGVFHSVADRYDLMNDFMSGTLHRLWKDEFVSMLGPVESPDPSDPVRYLDMAGGTGDISFRIAEALRSRSGKPVAAEIVVSDINPSMLGVGEQRARSKGLLDGRGLPAMSFVEADAEALPFESDTFDSYTIAFGIRNVTHVDRALAEAFRVLRPGGRFMCLEFSRVRNPVLAAAYDAYSFNVIPAVGQAVTGDRDSYQYLVESIRQFPNQEAFKGMIEDAGFVSARSRDMTFGVVAIHSGFKPMED